MQLLDKVPIDLMHATFLKAEFLTDNFVNIRKGIKEGLLSHITQGMSYSEIEDIVNNPDISNILHNTIRRDILIAVRKHLIITIPPSTRWYKAFLTKEEIVDKLYVINDINVKPEISWRHICENHSGKLKDICDKLLSSNLDEGRKGLRETIIASSKSDFDKTFILIGSKESGPFTIIEGNHRAVALYYRYVICNSGIEYPSHEVVVGIHEPEDKYLWE